MYARLPQLELSHYTNSNMASLRRVIGNPNTKNIYLIGNPQIKSEETKAKSPENNIHEK